MCALVCGWVEVRIIRFERNTRQILGVVRGSSHSTLTPLAVPRTFAYLAAIKMNARLRRSHDQALDTTS